MIAVISDIHGNMPALDAVLADIEARGIKTIYCLGDLIGKGPDSAEAVDKIRSTCTAVIKGNWDDRVVKVFDDYPVFQWHHDKLGAERIAYLDNLPHTIDFWMSGRPIRLYHASHRDVHFRIWPTRDAAILPEMFTNTDFTGHDHPEPTVVGYGDVHAAFIIHVKDFHTVFNCGAVGNPLDENNATYAILHGAVGSQKNAPFSIEIARIPYDIEAAIARAYAADMPDIEAYANELRTCQYRGANG